MYGKYILPAFFVNLFFEALPATECSCQIVSNPGKLTRYRDSDSETTDIRPKNEYSQKLHKMVAVFVFSVRKAFLVTTDLNLTLMSERSGV
jgi:hypothetical protein